MEPFKALTAVCSRSGGFSTVYRCISKKDNASYAVKVINMDKIKPTGTLTGCFVSPTRAQVADLHNSDKPKIEREAAICQMLSHRNVGTCMHSCVHE